MWLKYVHCFAFFWADAANRRTLIHLETDLGLTFTTCVRAVTMEFAGGFLETHIVFALLEAVDANHKVQRLIIAA